MKIFLLQKNVTDVATLMKGIDLAKSYASTIGLNLEFTFYSTTKLFTSVPVTSDVVTGGFGINSIEIFQEAKRLGYQPAIDSICCLIYDWTNINPRPTNPMDNGQVIQIPSQWYMSFPEVFASFFLHELSHYESSANNALDYTHNKYSDMWGGQFNQKSDIDYYLFLLKRFTYPVNSPEPLYAVLTRNTSDSKQTTGTLTVGDFTCKTLERPWLNNQSNISCIPVGTYQVKWSFFLRKLKYAYLLQNVPQRSGIFIHPANFFTDLKGCIALGSGYQDLNNDGELDIINSKVALGKFEALMGKNNFLLQIV